MALFTKLPSWASILITVIAAVIVVGLISWGTYTLVKPSPSKLPEGEETVVPPVTEDEFKDWKTYRNEEYGYQVRYPGNWEISCVGGGRNIEECKNNFQVLISGPTEENYQSPQIYINIGDNTKTAKETFSLRKSQFPFLEVFSESEVTVDGVLGYGGLVKLSRGGVQQIEKVIYLRKSNLYELYFAEAHNSDVNNLKWQSIFNQILSTFKFIEKTNASDWKTYRNEKYGFEVKYPQNMVLDFQEGPVIGIWSFGVYDPIVAKSVTGAVPSFNITNREVDTTATTLNKFEEKAIDSTGKDADISFKVGEKTLYATCIRFDDFKADLLKGLSLCNQILSTFKFIKQ